MFRIIDEPGTGKTLKLMEECNKNKGIFVCRNVEKALYIALENGFSDITFYSYDVFDFNYLYNKPVYIDELTKFIQFKVRDFNGYTEIINNWSEL